MKLGIYKRFDGEEYEVIGTVINEENCQEMVMYKRAKFKDKIWVMNISSWNEIIEKDGKCVKRFTHIDDIEPEQEIGKVNLKSSSKEKIELFMSLFCGREEVFAKRWESKNGISGYSPACANEWSVICPKARNTKIKCAECKNRKFVTLNENIIE